MRKPAAGSSEHPQARHPGHLADDAEAGRLFASEHTRLGSPMLAILRLRDGISVLSFLCSCPIFLGVGASENPGDSAPRGRIRWRRATIRGFAVPKRDPAEHKDRGGRSDRHAIPPRVAPSGESMIEGPNKAPCQSRQVESLDHYGGPNEGKMHGLEATMGGEPVESLMGKAVDVLKRMHHHEPPVVDSSRVPIESAHE